MELRDVSKPLAAEETTSEPKAQGACLQKPQEEGAVEKIEGEVDGEGREVSQADVEQ
jgi:hypothetical protein